MNMRRHLLPIAISLLLTSCQGATNLHRLTTPKIEKISTTLFHTMSETTYRSYMAFARKFSSLMWQYNDVSESLGLSIPDAYLCLAITGIISTEDAYQDVLSYLELENSEQLRTAVKEIVADFGTLFQNSQGKWMGGYNLNSIWLNPEKVNLIKEKDEQLYKDLEEVFDASLYYEALTSKKANDYLKENGLKDLPVPEIQLNDDDPSALNVMSTYYCLDYFDEDQKDYYLRQYKSGTHKMDFTYQNKTTQVDYIGRKENNVVYEGEGFVGSSLNIRHLDMAFFLPEERDAHPKSILNDVMDEKYHLKETVFKDYEEKECPTTIHQVNLQAPYFSLDNSLSLSHEQLKTVLPIITTKGAGERMAKAKNGYLYLDYLKQFSVMKFNYDGFYSCSVTIAGMEATSVGYQYTPFDLILDHPYLFQVRKTIRINNTRYTDVPLVVGQIITPNYSE